MRNLVRPLAFSALMTLLLAITACNKTQNSAFFREQPPIRDGKPVSAEVWDAAQKTVDDGTDAMPSREASTLWLLPFNSNISEARFTGEDTADGTKLTKLNTLQLTWNDVLIPVVLPTLPWRVKVRSYNYEPGTELPVGYFGLTYSPFVLEDRTVGKVDPDVTVKAKGLPLFFAQLRFRNNEVKTSRDTRIGVNTVLWTLGPAWLKFKSTQPATDGDKTVTQKGYVAAPLFLGGLWGLALWSDYHVRLQQPSGDDASAGAVGHGPLFGLAGYLHYHSDPSYREEKMKDDEGKDFVRTYSNDGTSLRHVLFGILWHDYTRTDAKSGERLYDRHGPLWSMFGWGHREDRLNIRLFFVPIG